MYTFLTKQPTSKLQAHTAVMIAGDHHDPKTAGAQLAQKIIQQCDRLLTGKMLVIHVPGNENDIHGFALRRLNDLTQQVSLIFQHGKTSNDLSQMKIRQM